VMVKFIKDAWRAGEVVTALFLDVKGAFPSVDVARLLHEMRRRGFPVEVIDWVEEKLKGRATRICFDDFQSEPINIGAGLDQGCALSGILYTVYNAPVIEIPKKDGPKKEESTGFIDDVTMLGRGRTFTEASRRVEDMMTRVGGAMEWAEEANCEYEVEKFALVGYSRQMEPDPLRPGKRWPIQRKGVTLRGRHIEPSTQAKYLGVIMNQTLSWSEQMAAALAKGMQWVACCRRIAKPTKGIPAGMVRQLYLAACIPKMLYAIDVWGPPVSRQAKVGQRRRAAGQLGKLERVQ
jgi:hypothetical protein